ncbi:MAG: hypothetical protein IE885_05965 [Campylobacterales bacterium]|nr:hypothetical protein [Campylobacterales bacterium]
MKLEKRANRNNVQFTEKEMKLATKIIEEIEKPVEILYYLLERQSERAFVIMLISSEDIDLLQLLKKEKRDTDLLYEIDKENDLYAMVCQETQVDGGFHFAERLMRNIILGNGRNIYCAELEIRTTKYSVRNVIIKLIDTYFEAYAKDKKDEIIFRSIY